jgi:hypothetical protein
MIEEIDGKRDLKLVMIEQHKSDELEITRKDERVCRKARSNKNYTIWM